LQVFLTSMYIDIVYLLICLFHVHRCCLFTDMSISGVNECSPWHRMSSLEIRCHLVPLLMNYYFNSFSYC
jgi:hypothetical protein